MGPVHTKRIRNPPGTTGRSVLLSPAPHPLALAILVTAAAFAGCLATEAPSPVADLAGAVLPYLPDEFPLDVDHDHADALLHDAHHNVDFVAYHACTADGTVASAVGGYTDVAFAGSLAFVGNGGGFCVLDVADPAHPTFVSQYAGEGASDLETSADGRYVFHVTQRNRPTSLVDPLAAPTANLPRGASVVDVGDPKNPTFKSYYPLPTNGVHTATPYKLGSRQLLFLQTYDWMPPGELQPPGVPLPSDQQNAPLTQRIEVTELVDVAGTPTLTHLATWSLMRPADQPLVYWYPHDAYAQYHPILKKHLLYVAYWDAGLVILDIDDPSDPKLLSRYSDMAPSKYNKYHDVRAFDELIDGRHITVTGPEIPSGPEAGHIRVFDTTDPAKPVQLGAWRLPGNPGIPGGFVFSPHVFTLSDGRVYLGHYHGGVWVLDVHNETLLREPASAGFFFPRGDEATQTWSPSSYVWGAYVHDGYVYATEGSSGVHVLHYAGDAAARVEAAPAP